ncbi:MAG: MHS family MFS transporter [Solirubrobacterales bacterium]|nr:MHS family MFS transporter [Solirubrobacterales bacterium]
MQTPIHSPGSYETDGVKKNPKMAAAASWIGSVLEYYDFFIYGTAAALVFGKVFFPKANPTTGTLLSLATYGAAYVARPVGAIFMGHLGDRFGRKRVLLLTVTLMGLATFLVGCLPTYSDIGIWAPILLVCLRLLQGLAASGEQAGANSIGLEHAPERRRAFYSSFTLIGTQAGLVIATAIWLPISSMPEHQLLTWGWRLPFWLSAVVTVVALVIRRKLKETPAFQEASKEGVLRIPLAELLRDHPANLARVTLGALASTVSTIFAVYALSFAVKTVKLDDTTMLWVAIATNLVALAAIPAWATLADRIGRKPVFIFGAVGSGALMFAYLAAIASGHYVLIFLAGIAMSGIVYSAQNGVWPALFGEMFPTRVRLSGVAIGTQIGFAIGGLIPTVAAAIAGKGSDGWWPVACLVLAMSMLAAIAISTARETHLQSLPELDRDMDRTAAPAPRLEKPAQVGSVAS